MLTKETLQTLITIQRTQCKYHRGVFVLFITLHFSHVTDETDSNFTVFSVKLTEYIVPVTPIRFTLYARITC